MKRIFILLSVLLLGGEILYVATFNSLLSSAFGKKLLNCRPDVFQIKYDAISSWWPGSVHVRRVSLSIQDPNVQLNVTADEAQMHLGIFAALRKTVHGTQGRAHGVQFFLRTRPDKTPSAATTKLLPPVTGFPTVSPRKELTKTEIARQPLIIMEDLQASDIREIWVDEYHYVGNASIIGTFSVKPNVNVEMNRATVMTTTGALSLGTRTIADQIRADIELNAPWFDLKTPQELLSTISGNATISAHVRSLSFANYYLRRTPEVRIENGTGTLSATVSVLKGVLQKNTSITADCKDISVVLPYFTAMGSGHLRWNVHEHKSRLHLDVHPFSVHENTNGNALVLRGEKLTLDSETANLTLSEQTGVRLVFDLADAKTDDLRFLNHYIPHGTRVEIKSGHGAIGSHFEIDSEKQSAHGDLDISAKDADIVNNTATLQGQVQVHGNVGHIDLKSGAIDLSQSWVALNDISVTSQSGKDEHWWAKLTLPQCMIRPQKRMSWEMFGVLQLKNAKPIGTVISANVPVPGLSLLLVTIKDIHASVHLSGSDDTLNVDDLSASTKSGVSAQGFMSIKNLQSKTDQKQKGAFLLQWQKLAIGIDIDNQKKHVVLIKPTQWFEKQKAEKKEIN